MKLSHFCPCFFSSECYYKSMDTTQATNPEEKTMAHPNIRRIYGQDAIDLAREDDSIVLCKFADPIEGAIDDISIEDAEDVARDDPSLIYADTVAQIAPEKTTAQ